MNAIKETYDFNYIPDVTGWYQLKDEAEFCNVVNTFNYQRVLCGCAIGYKRLSDGRVVALEFVKSRGNLTGYKFFVTYE